MPLLITTDNIWTLFPIRSHHLSFQSQNRSWCCVQRPLGEREQHPSLWHYCMHHTWPLGETLLSPFLPSPYFVLTTNNSSLTAVTPPILTHPLHPPPCPWKRVIQRNKRPLPTLRSTSSLVYTALAPRTPAPSCARRATFKRALGSSAGGFALGKKGERTGKAGDSGRGIMRRQIGFYLSRCG